ncbi:MAG: hypothetical protein SGI90_08775 [Candidatus Eisenbacteria bacterium]|nr:hypothetical protein [Candidatus Eisenbacteria bacterium]
MSNRLRSPLAGIGLAALLLMPGLFHPAIVTPAAAQAGQSADPIRSKRMLREITVLEKVIDEMLLDSKNVLIYTAGGVAHGLYMDEFGVLFSFEASLVDRSDDMQWPESWEGFSFGTDEHGNVIIKKNKEKRSQQDPPIAPKPPVPPRAGENPKSSPTPRTWIDKQAGKQAKLYDAGKGEIIETLIEYGESMNSLRDNQWLCFAAFLKNSDFFLERRISRLVVKARMSDLRSYAQGRLDRKQMLARVVEEEY